MAVFPEIIFYYFESVLNEASMHWSRDGTGLEQFCFIMSALEQISAAKWIVSVWSKWNSYHMTVFYFQKYP